MRPFFRRFRQSEDGVLTVEFALALPAFLAIVVGSMEVAWYFFIASSMENAVLHASRYGVTGSDNTVISREARVREIIGEQTFGKVDMDKLELTTEVYEQFADIDVPEPFDDTNGDGVWTIGELYTDVNGNGQWDESLAVTGLGGGNDIVLYRIRYETTGLTGLFDWASKFAPIEATVAVRNEPY